NGTASLANREVPAKRRMWLSLENALPVPPQSGNLQICGEFQGYRGFASSKLLMLKLVGGEGGIRTPDTLSGMPVFKTGAINRSATSPRSAGYLRLYGVLSCFGEIRLERRTPSYAQTDSRSPLLPFCAVCVQLLLALQFVGEGARAVDRTQ